MDSNGDRISPYSLLNYNAADNTWTLVAIVTDASARFVSTPVFAEGRLSVPIDVPVVSRQRMTVGLASQLAVIVAGALGIAIAAAVISFSTWNRNLPFIKFSTPVMNNCIALGTVLAYMAMIVNAASNVVSAFQCTCWVVFVTVAFSLSFGGLFLKTYRVYKVPFRVSEHTTRV